ncbi:VWA domain-containing protein [Corynebacterium mendelii]|uniref:VWA domain-containing protein n=1 Tax=Corynebacterium mendelii TaxID=2765362 RepID=A0A939E0B2_9CORY|nr:VWA domain-containing protein [Corynebacterium mendelii]MBN9644099.1 VWA domain-containing protein [Corynebacterium mendelii]
MPADFFSLVPAALRAWAATPGVGLVVTGDAVFVDVCWPEFVDLLRSSGLAAAFLTPAMELAVISGQTTGKDASVIAAGDSFSPEQAAAVGCRKLLVRSTGCGLPSILADRCPLVLELSPGKITAGTIRGLLHGSGLAVVGAGDDAATGRDRSTPPDQWDPAADVVDMITAAGLAGAGLDVPAALFADRLAAEHLTRDEVLTVVAQMVIGPRTGTAPPPPPPQPQPQPQEDDTSGSTDKDNSGDAQPGEPEELSNQRQSGTDPDPDALADQETHRPQSPPADSPPPAGDPLDRLPAVRRRTGAGATVWPGAGSAPLVSPVRGRIVRITTPTRPGQPVHLPATLAAACVWQKLRKKDTGHTPGTGNRLVVTRDDLRTAQRSCPAGGLSVIVVDASGSMGLGAIGTAKAVAMNVLEGSYRRRDKVAVVVVRGEKAYVGLDPTRSITKARQSLTALPTGGGTPLADGLLTACRIAARHDKDRVKVVVLTDGAANIGLTATGKQPARADAKKAFGNLQRVASVVRVVPLSNRRSRGRRRSSSVDWLTG